MYTLSNQDISIQIANKGAELQSIYQNLYKLEYLWNGDPLFWGKKSPVLFPIVGELKNKSYIFKGKKYTLNRHGFAREMDFKVTDHNENSVTFSIEANEKTQTVFPFPFVFSVKYTLEENIVDIRYIVKNSGTEKLFFSVGGHPAFKVPMVEETQFEDFYLLFNQNETTGRFPLDTNGLTEQAPTPLLDNQNILHLKKKLFTADAIVLKHIKSTSVTLKSEKTPHGVKVDFKGFPYLGIWETKGGDFLCIEPWHGIADSVNATGNLEEKEGVLSLHPDETFSASFFIEVF